MAAQKAQESIPQCNSFEFRSLLSHQIPIALLSYPQIQPDYISPYFSPEKALSKVPVPTEKRRVLDHLSNRILESKMPGAKHVADYLLHKYRNNLAVPTLKQAGNVTFSFLSFLKKSGVSRLEDISRKDICAYVENCQDRGFKIVAVKSYIVAVYTFLGFLVDQKVLPKEILHKKIQLKLPQSLPRAIPQEDIQALLPLISDVRDQAMILLLLRTGMRIGELLNVKIVDIILPERKILIYLGEKNYRGRVAYFAEDADLALRQWLKVRNRNAEHLFYGYTTEKLSYAAARKALRKYLIKAGFEHKGYGLHSLRHYVESGIMGRRTFAAPFNGCFFSKHSP